MPADPGGAALATYDQALAKKPHPDGQLFSETTRHLCAYRSVVTARYHAGNTSRRSLEHLNAIISIVLAGHFPLGETPWPELEKARTWLADLIAEPINPGPTS